MISRHHHSHFSVLIKSPTSISTPDFHKTQNLPKSSTNERKKVVYFCAQSMNQMASSSAAKTHQKPHRRLHLNPQAPPFLRRSYHYSISRQPPPPLPTYQWVPVVPCVVSAPPNPMINNANVDLQGSVPVAAGPRRVWRPRRKVDLQGASTSGGGCGGRRKRSSRRGGGSGGCGGGGGDIIPFPCKLEDLFKSGKTTVMIKNVPNQLRRTDLLHILGCHCWHQNSIDLHKSMFDFVYLPMDFNKFWHEKKVKNLGYAFVNFTTPIGAQRFYEGFHKKEWVVSYNKKVCEITTARIQGKKALVRNFKTKIFWCHSDEYLPAVVEPACDGNMLPNATTIGHLAGRPSRSS